MAQPVAITEAQLTERLAREGLMAARWSNGPRAVYGAHDHPYGKILYVVSGSITFTLNEGKRVIEMTPGDRLDLAPQTRHSAVVGPDGVVCLEAHLPSQPTQA